MPVYILAGGHSRRFGTDKARATIDGVIQLVALAEVLRPVASSMTVVAAQPAAYEDLGFDTVGDVVPEQGPIGGLLTALEHRGGDGWLLLSACDWVGVESEWLAELFKKQHEAKNVILFKSERYEPLLSLYHTSVRPVVHDQIDAGELAMHRLLSRLDVAAVPTPAGWRRVSNRNRPPRPT